MADMDLNETEMVHTGDAATALPASADDHRHAVAPLVVRVDLLGPPRVTQGRGAERQSVSPPKLYRVWPLLARLRRERSIVRANVLEFLWDGDADRSAALDAVNSAARKALGRAEKALVINRNQPLRLDPDQLPDGVVLEFDTDAFYDLATRRDPHTACAAIRLYRGRLLEGLVFDQTCEDWLDGERERQEEQLGKLLAVVFPWASPHEIAELRAACHDGRSHEVAEEGARRLSTGARQQSAPSAVVRNLPIGVIAPVSAWPTAFYTNIIKGIRAGAEADTSQARRRIVVFDIAREDLSEVDDVITSAIAQAIPGLITLNATWSEPLHARLEELGRPVVSVMFADPHPAVSRSIVIDNSPFAEMLAHVFDVGPCSCAVLVTPPPFDPARRAVIDLARNDKRNSYEEAVRARDLTLQPTRTIDDASISQPYREGHAYIAEIRSYRANWGERLFGATGDLLPPETAVVFLNDCQAASFIAACGRSGRTAVERGLRICGYEDTDAATWLQITTVDPKLDDIGRLSYQRLQEALDDSNLPYLTEPIPGTILYRQSTEWKRDP